MLQLRYPNHLLFWKSLETVPGTNKEQKPQEPSPLCEGIKRIMGHNTDLNTSFSAEIDKKTWNWC